MSLSMYSLTQRTPILTEMFFILIVGAGFTVNMANFDINQHFYYVLPDQSFCNQTQISNPFCIGLWAKLGLPAGDQADIPNKYWMNLNITVLSFGGLLALSRLGTTVVLSKALGIKLLQSPMKFYKDIIAYGATVTIFPLFSYGDYLYYVLQNQTFPPDWRWLDGMGIYPWLLQFTGEQHVSTNDVYIAMTAGFGLALLIWLPIVIRFKKHRGIAKQIV